MEKQRRSEKKVVAGEVLLVVYLKLRPCAGEDLRMQIENTSVKIHKLNGPMSET